MTRPEPTQVCESITAGQAGTRNALLIVHDDDDIHAVHDGNNDNDHLSPRSAASAG